ncbi:hypothetical protein ACP70R_035362 [Stipagrostis hirtigluma subsp. patula]
MCRLSRRIHLQVHLGRSSRPTIVSGEPSRHWNQKPRRRRRRRAFPNPDEPFSPPAAAALLQPDDGVEMHGEGAVSTVRAVARLGGLAGFGTPGEMRRVRGRAIVCTAVSFRPCIDIHKGKVKQIVGSTLRDSSNDGTALVTNFESDKSPAEFANLYKEDELVGGHVIMLGADPASQAAALEALRAYPGGLQYVFSDGKMNIERLTKLVELVGKQRLVLDLSCRKKDGRYTIVTDRWQKFSDVIVDEPTLEYLATFADEFLVHGVDVEGKRLGIDEELVELLGRHSPIPVTYAGGVSTMDDLERIKKAGKSRVDVTVGSALDIFGGDLPYKDVVHWHKEQNMVNRP